MKAIARLAIFGLCIANTHATTNALPFDANQSPILVQLNSLNETSLKNLCDLNIPETLTQLVQSYKTLLDDYQRYPTVARHQALVQIETLLIQTHGLIKILQDHDFRDAIENKEQASSIDPQTLIQQQQQVAFAQLAASIQQTNNAISQFTKESLDQKMKRYWLIAKWTLGTVAVVTTIALSIYFGKQLYDYIFDPEGEQHSINEAFDQGQELKEKTKEVNEKIQEVRKDIDVQGQANQRAIDMTEQAMNKLEKLRKNLSNDEKFARVLVNFENRLNQINQERNEDREEFNRIVAEMQKQLSEIEQEVARQANNMLDIAQISYGRARAKTDADCLPTMRFAREENSGNIVTRLKSKMLQLLLKLFLKIHPDQTNQFKHLLTEQ